MSAFRLALVGAGRMGSTHARALGAHPAIEIAAVVDPSDAATAALGLDVPRFRDVSELLDHGRPDGALVAVPTRLHVEVVSSLLAARVPVLCEKPLGLTVAHAEQLGRLASNVSVPLRVGYWRRFVPELRALKNRIVAGELGTLQLLICAQWDQRPPPPAFRDPASSGGILVDMAVHELDEIRWLTGQEVVRAWGVASPIHTDPPVPGDPESVAFVLALSGGATAFVSLIRRHPPGDVVRFEVVGTESVVRLEPLGPPDGDERLHAALRAQVSDFVLAARGGLSTGATAADAAAALRATAQLEAALRR